MLRKRRTEYKAIDVVQLWKDKGDMLGQEVDINMQLNHAGRAVQHQAHGLV